MAKNKKPTATISNYYKSFSGTDTLAFILMPGSSPVLIGSLTTVSYSMYRNKRPVINIGRTNINGVTRGSRIFAGTMVFTLINQHWLRELQEQVDWLNDFNKLSSNGISELKVDELPLFDIMIVSANEYGSYVSMFIYGIDFTDEAQTISVEDLFTENVFSFIARDISIFRAGRNNNKIKRHKRKNGSDKISQKFYVLDTNVTSEEEVRNLELEFSKSQIKQRKKKSSKPYTYIARELYYNTSHLIIGSDVVKLQELLNEIEELDSKLLVTGIFDEETEKAVMKFQSLVGDEIDGVVSERLYNKILVYSDYTGIKERTGIVVNIHGTYVYKRPSILSDIVDTLIYKNKVDILGIELNDDDLSPQKFYKTSTGYVVVQDIFSAFYSSEVIEFPKIKYNDENPYVFIIQSALSTIYDDFTGFTNGKYDDITKNTIMKFQEEHGLNPTGIVDNDTWILLQAYSDVDISKIKTDNIVVDYEVPPYPYHFTDHILENLNQFNITINSPNSVSVKFTAISFFDDGTETMSELITISGSVTVNIKDLFQNAFLYNPSHGQSPSQVDYIVYIYGKDAFKWSIHLD